MQNTDFPIEILIHDDASTDGTDTIIREYATKYPDIIYPLYETENQFSKGKSSLMDIEYNYSRARGKYIATCEGDDFWTDPLKLSKQVAFLEDHPDYSVCFHRCRYLYYPEMREANDACASLFLNGEEGVDVSVKLFLERWVTQPLTMIFRKGQFDPSWQSRYEYYRDSFEIYHLLNVGKGYLFSFVGGTHVKHKGGMSSSKTPEERMRAAYQLTKELYSKNISDPCLKDSLVRIIKYIIDKQYFNNDRCSLFIDYMVLTKEIVSPLKLFFKGIVRSPHFH